MVRLLTLGAIDVVQPDGTRASSVLQQPRRLALLVYLAVASDSLVQRDRLLALFWPERPESEARHALSQSIHYLRRSLGPDVIEGRGAAGFGIAEGALRCDARDLAAACRRGDAARILALYSGEFLPGFFIDAAPGFEQWMEQQRTSFRREAAEAAWRLAETARTADPMHAAAHARRAVDLSLGDEAAVRRLMQLLYELGDTAGALDAYGALEDRLRAEYECAPSAETTALRDRIGAQRAASAVSPGRAVEVESRAPTPPEPIVSPGSSGRRGVRAFVMVAAAVLIAFATFSLWGTARGPAIPTGTPVLILEPVQEFPATGRVEGLGEAITLALLAGLAELDALAVLAGEPGSDVQTSAPAFVLRGGVETSSDAVRATAVLLDRHSGVALARADTEWPREGETIEAARLGSWFASFAKAELRDWLELRRLAADAPFGAALRLVQAAAREREAGDSLAEVGATEAAVLRLRAADSILVAAQAAAPAWPEPTVQRGETALLRMWARMVQQAPASQVHAEIATARQHAHTVLGRVGEHADALELAAAAAHWQWRLAAPGAPGIAAVEAELRRVLEIDPARARAWNLLAAVLQTRGEFAQAHWAAERARRADPYGSFQSDNLARLFLTSLEIDDVSGAASACEELGRLSPQGAIHGFCRLTLIAWPERTERDDVQRAWRIMDGLPRNVREGQPWCGRLRGTIAAILAAAGMPDSARAVLDSAVTLGAGDPEMLPIVAWTTLRLGIADSAAATLERYVAERPEGRRGVLASARFASLRDRTDRGLRR